MSVRDQYSTGSRTPRAHPASGRSSVVDFAPRYSDRGSSLSQGRPVAVAGVFDNGSIAGASPTQLPPARATGRSASATAEATAGTSTLNAAVKREIVEAKLTQFYREHAPEKLVHIPEIYETYQHQLPDLFAQLIAKYPRATRNTFDEVLALLQHSNMSGGASGGDFASRGHPSGPHSSSTPLGATELAQWHAEVAEASAAKTTGAALPSAGGGTNATRGVAFDLSGSRRAGQSSAISSLLSAGQALLDASPVAPSSVLTREVAKRAEGYRHQMDELEELVAENLRLAQRVAEAELAVLHERLRVLLCICLQADHLDQGLREDSFLEIAEGPHRLFRVPLSEALWAYVREGPLKAPLPAPVHGTRLCTVSAKGLPGQQSSASAAAQGRTTLPPVEVDSNIMAAAMREWERQKPHTVLELRPTRLSDQPQPPMTGGGGEFRAYHAGSTLWWSWPAPVQRMQGLPAVSIFADALDGSDAAIAKTLSEPLKADPYCAEAFEALGIADAGGLAGYWSHVVNHYDALSKELSEQQRQQRGAGR